MNNPTLNLFQTHEPARTSQLRVVHCGHPTAHRPYYIEGIEAVVAFRLKAVAEKFVAAVIEHGERRALSIFRGHYVSRSWIGVGAK